MTFPEGSIENELHFSVLLNEVIEALSPKVGDKIIDGTFGAGGYSRAILEKNVSMLWGIDRDPSVMCAANQLKDEFPENFKLLKGCFSDMENLLRQETDDFVDGIVLDIGVSSMQLDQAERGFSFIKDGPLDMRMGDQGPTAADVVNEKEEAELADIIYQFGKEFTRTLELAKIVEKAVGGPRYKKGKRQIHSATRTFQALRIYVNDELGELHRGLIAAEKILAPGGRLCVVTFHSLEDRMVKNFFKSRSGDISQVSRHKPTSDTQVQNPTFSMIFRGGKKASEEEIEGNIRSRSAKLRAAVRTLAAPWNKEMAA
jgi:16S rRNA (cytosine1402-N4)-methyltransferase